MMNYYDDNNNDVTFDLYVNYQSDIDEPSNDDNDDPMDID